MTTIGQRVRQCVNALGITQQALAIDCGWDEVSRLNHYINGKRGVRLENISKIAKALKAPPEWIAFGAGCPPPYLSPDKPSPGSFPFVSWGELIDSLKNKQPLIYDSTMEFITLNHASPNCFIIRLQNDYMSSPTHKVSFKPDDLLLIDPNLNQPKHLSYVLSMEDEWDEPLFAQYIIRANKHSLMTLSDLEKTPVTRKIKIIGTVIARLNFLI